ncbi:MAG TPA: DUF6701 domain-containing protein [Rhodocyclaceae bacterium]|jgi:MSHA biogenesis protein MshQ
MTSVHVTLHRFLFSVLFVLVGFGLPLTALATTYTMAPGSQPVCSSGSWTISGSTYTCDGSFSLASGDSILPGTGITILAKAGITLNDSVVVGSASSPVNLQTIWGDISGTSSGTKSITGTLTADSGAINLRNATVTGAITTNSTVTLNGGSVTGNVSGANGVSMTNGTTITGNVTTSNGSLSLSGGSVTGNVSGANGVSTTNGTTISGNVTASNGTVSLSGGSVGGSVYSNCCVVTTNNTNVANGVGSGSVSSGGSSTVSITGGTISGAIYSKGGSGIQISNATVTSGSITTSNVPIAITNSTIGSSGSQVNVTSNNTVTVSNSTVYGSVTAGSWSGALTVDQTSTVHGVCTSDTNSNTSPGNYSYRCDGGVSATCNPPSNAPGIALTCVCDTFTRSALNPSTIFGSNWEVSTSDTTGVIPSIVNQGYLRLTNNTSANAKAATVPGVFPASGNYISVEFKHYAYNGTNPGADGMAVTLSDYSQIVVPGAFGGSLGYAQKSNPGSDCTITGGCPGFSGGWVGVALDEYGNYSAATEGRIGGPSSTAQSIGVRGPGAGANGYRWMGGNLGIGNIDNRSSTTPAPGYMYQVIVDARNVASGQALIYVNRDTTTKDGSNYTNLFGGTSGFNAYTEANYALSQGWISSVVPDYWKISFTGSTGANNNIHEIGQLRVCAQTVYPPPDNAGVTASVFSAIDETYVFPAQSSQWQQYQTGHIYTKLAGVPFKLNVAAISSAGVRTNYVTSGSKTVTVRLVDNSDGACTLGSSSPSNACLNKTTIATQNLTFTSSDSGQKQTSTFTVAAAYRQLAVIVGDSSTKAVAIDVFAVRPTSMTLTTTASQTSPASGPPTFKAGTDSFNLSAVINASGYTGTPKVNNGTLSTSVTATDTVNASGFVGSFSITTLSAATSGASTSTTPATASTYSEAGAVTLKGYCPTGSNTAPLSVCSPTPSSDTLPRGVYDGVDSTSECATLSATQCDTLRTASWTGVDSALLQGDCIANSYSNAKSSNGKYGCNFGITTSYTLGRFTPDHFTLITTSLCGGLSGSTHTTGAIALGSSSVTVNDASCLSAGQTITISGAGTSGNPLATTISAVNGNVVSLVNATGTAVTSAVLSASSSGSLSYMDQPFRLGLAIEARNGLDVLTRNYTRSLSSTYVAENQAGPGVSLSARLSGMPSVACTNGNCSGQAATAKFSRPTSPASQDGPYDMLDFGIQASDIDSIAMAGLDLNSASAGTTTVSGELVDSCISGSTCTAKRIGRVKERFGRLALENVYGSELLDIRMKVRATYWDGSRWTTHIDDSVTTLPANSFALGSYLPTGTALSSSMGTTHLPASSLVLNQGVATLILTKPSPTATGSFDVVANLNGAVANPSSCEPVGATFTTSSSAALPWLLGNWCGSNFDRAPSARVKVGSSKAPFIYLRERY